MSVFIDQMPAPPVDMVMPQLANQIFTAANFTVLSVFAVILILACRKEKSLLPILFLIGGMLGVCTEPFFDIMVCAWYPTVGVTTVVSGFNVGIPLWLIAAWGIYMGGQGYYVYKAFIRGMSAKTLMLLLPIFWITNVIIEIPGLLMGVYTYYGPQAFPVFGFPLWMGLSNAMMPIVIAASIYMLRDVLVGSKVWLTLFIVPMSGLGGAAAVGFPMWWALHGGGGLAVTRPATLAVLFLACIVLYILTQTVCRRERPVIQG